MTEDTFLIDGYEIVKECYLHADTIYERRACPDGRRYFVRFQDGLFERCSYLPTIDKEVRWGTGYIGANDMKSDWRKLTTEEIECFSPYQKVTAIETIKHPCYYTHSLKPNQTKPNQTKPNQTKPNQTKPNK